MGTSSVDMPSLRYKLVDHAKSTGKVYTPESLSNFIAQQVLKVSDITLRPYLKILDPAVGDGALLKAILKNIPKNYSGTIEVWAFDTDVEALEKAKLQLSSQFNECVFHFHHDDFLSFQKTQEDSLFFKKVRFDLIIANPPYIRTQVLGKDRAQELGREYGLNGRIDLYQAFLLVLSHSLEELGVMGVITPNRFMTAKSGERLRAFLKENISLKSLWDLGDTKLFNAAVLPSILIGQKCTQGQQNAPSFVSIYEERYPAKKIMNKNIRKVSSIIDVLHSNGLFELPDGRYFKIQKGVLAETKSSLDTWRLASKNTDTWLSTVQNHTQCLFGDVGNVRVGIKTCADRVFIQSDWEAISKGRIPELLRPLITRKSAAQFRAQKTTEDYKVLYPHENKDGKRRSVDLSKYPNSQKYLLENKDILVQRSYVEEAGRNWYEIWVPHDPDVWSKPKLVFPDISEKPLFFIDTSGALVKGDSFWMTLKEGKDPDFLWLACAVANSGLIEKFYDHSFNNKLYSGKRRFVTQYVEKFPLPDINLPLSQKLITQAKAAYNATSEKLRDQLTRDIDDLVSKVFGV